MIKISNLSYMKILNHITLEIPNGFTFVKGDNGSGKTALLDCIAGINTSYQGEVSGNEDVVYLNQNLYFSYKLKVKDFVKFVYSLEGLNIYQEPIYRNLYIKSIWNKTVGSLSGGERKKLYFSTIVSLERKWYLFDEPFAHVDDKGKEYMMNELTRLTETGRNIIITTHEGSPLSKVKDLHTITLVSIE